MVSSAVSRDRQTGILGLRDARHGLDQTSNIYSSINTLPALLLLHAPFVSASSCDTVDTWLLDFQQVPLLYPSQVIAPQSLTPSSVELRSSD
jgi:hypothetical protein